MVLPDINVPLAALWGCGFAGAVLFLIHALRGSNPHSAQPQRRIQIAFRNLRNPVVGARIAAAVFVFVAVIVLTRWPVAAVALAGLVLCWPLLFGGTRAEAAQIARLEALVVWTESLRDTMAAHASLEQAIPVTAPNASPLLRPALIQLVGQLRARVPMDRALLQLAAELDDPSADLVLAALILNVRRRGDRLGEVLSGLATAAREELDLRRQDTAGRAEIRRGVRIMIGLTVAFGVFLTMFGGDYTRPYGTFTGQIALAVVCGMFAAGFAWMRKLSGAEPAMPFLVRPDRVPDPDEVALVASLTGMPPNASHHRPASTPTAQPAAWSEPTEVAT